MMNVMYYQRMNHACIYVTVAPASRSFFLSEMLRDKADFKPKQQRAIERQITAA